MPATYFHYFFAQILILPTIFSRRCRWDRHVSHPSRHLNTFLHPCFLLTVPLNVDGADYVDSGVFLSHRNLFILTISPRNQLTASLMTMRHLTNYHMPYFNQNVQISQRTFLYSADVEFDDEFCMHGLEKSFEIESNVKTCIS